MHAPGKPSQSSPASRKGTPELEPKLTNPEAQAKRGRVSLGIKPFNPPHAPRNCLRLRLLHSAFCLLPSAFCLSPLPPPSIDLSASGPVLWGLNEALRGRDKLAQCLNQEISPEPRKLFARRVIRGSGLHSQFVISAFRTLQPAKCNAQLGGSEQPQWPRAAPATRRVFAEKAALGHDYHAIKGPGCVRRNGHIEDEDMARGCVGAHRHPLRGKVGCDIQAALKEGRVTISNLVRE